MNLSLLNMKMENERPIEVYTTLTPEHMRSHASELNWKLISRWQVLTEPLMREFANFLHWKCNSRGPDAYGCISRWQCFSPEFAEEFKDRLDPLGCKYCSTAKSCDAPGNMIEDDPLVPPEPSSMLVRFEDFTSK